MSRAVGAHLVLFRIALSPVSFMVNVVADDVVITHAEDKADSGNEERHERGDVEHYDDQQSGADGGCCNADGGGHREPLGGEHQGRRKHEEAREQRPRLPRHRAQVVSAEGGKCKSEDYGRLLRVRGELVEPELHLTPLEVGVVES
eukprot:scaffold105085_cov32-Tisochrysis_lutea.AAC.4